MLCLAIVLHRGVTLSPCNSVFDTWEASSPCRCPSHWMPGQVDGLVHAGLEGLGADDIHGGLNHSEDGDVVAGFLGDLLA